MDQCDTKNDLIKNLLASTYFVVRLFVLYVFDYLMDKFILWIMDQYDTKIDLTKYV